MAVVYMDPFGNSLGYLGVKLHRDLGLRLGVEFKNHKMTKSKRCGCRVSDLTLGVDFNSPPKFLTTRALHETVREIEHYPKSNHSNVSQCVTELYTLYPKPC